VVLAPERSLGVILPMSGRTSSFTTAGTRFMGAAFIVPTASIALPVRSFTSRRRPAW
jgi:hypothetical protein